MDDESANWNLGPILNLFVFEYNRCGLLFNSVSTHTYVRGHDCRCSIVWTNWVNASQLFIVIAVNLPVKYINYSGLCTTTYTCMYMSYRGYVLCFFFRRGSAKFFWYFTWKHASLCFKIENTLFVENFRGKNQFHPRSSLSPTKKNRACTCIYMYSWTCNACFAVKWTN